MKLGNGKELVINAPQYSSENIFIQKMTVNGSPYSENSISHDMLLNGGIWNFDLYKCPVE